MISAILPSRGRPESLIKSVLSLRALAVGDVEVVVAFDPDDPETCRAALTVDAVVSQPPERWGYSQMWRYLNLTAEFAVGDWLLVWNDDAEMTTFGWDEQIEALPAHVMVADLHNEFSPGLNCFPAVRREAVAALGGFCTAETPHVDSWWQEIGRRSGTSHAITAHVHHDRFDITGGHEDATWREGRSGLRHTEFFSPQVQAQIDTAAAVIAELAAARRPA